MNQMQTSANAEIVVYSGKSQGQADRDSRYKIDKQKNGQNLKSHISRYRRGTPITPSDDS